MNVDEAMNHRVYSWSDTNDVEAIGVLQDEVKRLRDLGMAYKERAMSAESKLARVETLLDEHDQKQWCAPTTDEVRAALKGEP